jgi:hypothetical protein
VTVDHDALRALAHRHPGIAIYPHRLRAACWPPDAADEFGAYLAEQLRDPEVRAAYEAERHAPATAPAERAARPPTAPAAPVALPPVTRWRWWRRWARR